MDAHRRKLPGFPADQNNVEVQSNINEEKNVLSNSNEEKQASNVVIGRHPAGLMLSFILRVYYVITMIGMISFNKYLVVRFLEKD